MLLWLAFSQQQRQYQRLCVCVFKEAGDHRSLDNRPSRSRVTSPCHTNGTPTFTLLFIVFPVLTPLLPLLPRPPPSPPPLVNNTRVICRHTDSSIGILLPIESHELTRQSLLAGLQVEEELKAFDFRRYRQYRDGKYGK